MFSVTVVDDGILDGSQISTITATASLFQGASANMVVHDNETTTLAVNAPAEVTEGGGVVSRTISIGSAAASQVQVALSSSDTSELQVPATVFITAGQTGATFNITIPDDNLIDGDQTAVITAQVTNWTAGIASVIVHDNESNALTVSLPALAKEGNGLLANAGAVLISGVLQSNLTVNLASDDTMN